MTAAAIARVLRPSSHHRHGRTPPEGGTYYHWWWVTRPTREARTRLLIRLLLIRRLAVPPGAGWSKIAFVPIPGQRRRNLSEIFAPEFGMSRDMRRHDHRNFISIGYIGDESFARTFERISGMTSNRLTEAWEGKALFKIRSDDSSEF
ncbi:hypothetical protein AVEN_272495-1 [Araneus ventricosus]|uniref:Uncharacterized protein n=1 Tax=Araneus ventricosus TaxID=182803 RepID=A0A4Y2JW43_ARAVE|nr:hypothetical protein AVEN_272495-1 [Araneus ventricosus]